MHAHTGQPLGSDTSTTAAVLGGIFTVFVLTLLFIVVIVAVLYVTKRKKLVQSDHGRHATRPVNNQTGNQTGLGMC